MMSTRGVLFLCASCAISIAACDRDGDAVAPERVAPPDREAPPAVAERDRGIDTPEPGVQRDTQAVRERETQATRETEAAREPESAPRAVPADQLLTARRAEAQLDTVGKAKLEAEATLKETTDGVEVVVHVEDAKPGTRSVRIYDRADCEDLDEKPLGEPLAGSNKQGDLGSVTIGPNGKGTLETKAFNASLKPDDRGSLLGKTIVVQERDGTSPKSDGQPIACGVIKVEDKLADKAGRMTEPTP